MPSPLDRIAELEPSPRAGGLLECLRARYEASGSRLLHSPDEAEAWCEAALRAYRLTSGRPAAIRRARVLKELAETGLVRVLPDELVVGSQSFNPATRHCPERGRELTGLGYAATSGHIVHDYQSLLDNGVSGLRHQLSTTVSEAEKPDTRDTAVSLVMALNAFARWIARHADACRQVANPQANAVARLAEQPPTCFTEALQLLWFAHVFLHAENPSVAISFGRLDQLLGPFLEADLERGRIDLPEALDWLVAFFAKCCEGEESQNAVLGGVDENGSDATNTASYLILRAMACARTFQPSLVVRLHKDTPAAFRKAATALAAGGGGNPGFMNDEVVIPSLQCLGIPLERARDWSVIGCYEAAPTGDCYPNTVIGGMHLPELLGQTVASSGAADFEEFLDDYLEQIAAHYRRTVLLSCKRRWEYWRESAPSPFGSLLMRGCMSQLACLETGAAPHNLAGINILGIGTAIDGLLVVKKRVFEEAALSLAQLRKALADDFPDEPARRSLTALPGRFGTDSAESNTIAERLSRAIADMVLESRFGPGVRPYPAFFRFLADVHQVAQPSPDGRRRGELISYGCGPAKGVTDSATSLLNSCTHIAHERAGCGNPVLLSLSPEDCAGEAGRARLEALLLGYFAAGGSHLHVNVTDAADLRMAKEKPTEYEDLTVRVSGFSARFVKLDEAVQNALIARIEAGER